MNGWVAPPPMDAVAGDTEIEVGAGVNVSMLLNEMSARPEKVHVPLELPLPDNAGPLIAGLLQSTFRVSPGEVEGGPPSTANSSWVLAVAWNRSAADPPFAATLLNVES